MKLGFVSSILDGWDFEEMIDVAAEADFDCVEVACWPKAEGATRRYAGVSHIDVENLGPESVEHIKKLCKEKQVEIAAVAYYPNPMDGNAEIADAAVVHMYKVIDAAYKLGVPLVTTFIGRDQYKSVEMNLEKVKAVWSPILEYALERKIKIAIENCPMFFGSEQWPGGQNLMTSPKIWREVFRILDYPNLGLAFDPSHFVWQRMDYISVIKEFSDCIFHIHFKDIKVYPDKLKEVGVMAYPLEYMAPKLPGLGDVKWDEFISALTDIGYKGSASIEVEDRAFEGSREQILYSLVSSKNYLNQFPM